MKKIFNIRITKECNRRCSYCTIKNFEGNAPLNIIIDTIEYLQSKGVQDIGIYGGEVFLHPHINDILDRFPNQLNILTNGDFINDSRMKLFKNVIISLHDEFSSKTIKDFDKYLKVNKFLVVITHENYKQVLKEYNLLSEENKARIRLIPYKNTKINDMFITEDDKEIIKGLNKSEYELMNIPAEECLKKVRITNIDLINNSMAYCCISHYTTKISKPLIDASIINSTQYLNMEKQLKDCSLCTKRWE